MSLGEIGSGRTSVRRSITHYTRALDEAPASALELRVRLMGIIETLRRIDDGETPMALRAAREAART